MMQFAPFVSIALPTFEDEYYLHGDNDPMRTASRWRAWGAGEIVVKLGSRGCMLMEGEIVPPRDKIIPVDTTAAGDSFNAGYIAGRHRGMTVRESAEFANGLAARVIGYPGAIIPASALTDLVAVLDAGRRSLDHD